MGVLRDVQCTGAVTQWIAAPAVLRDFKNFSWFFFNPFFTTTNV